MWLWICVAAFFIAVASHCVLAHVKPNVNRVIGFFAIGAMIGVSAVLGEIYLYGFSSVKAMAGMLVFALACELYIFLITLALSSISANLLARLHEGSMTLAEVEALYDSDRMVRNRVLRLIDSGFLRVGPSAVVVTRKGARLLRALHAMRVLFGHEKFGAKGE